MPRRLILSGGFTVNDARHHPLQQQASRLGFADLRACLQALLDDGWSIPQLAAHLGATQLAIRAAIADHHIRQPPRRQRLARQRQRAAQQRAAARAAELGLPGCGRIWWTGWSPRRGRWLRWPPSFVPRPRRCGACSTSTGFGGSR